jgi:copper chaperone CopZ
MAEPTSACSADKACHNVTAEKDGKETLPCCEKDDCSKNEETGTAKKDSPCCNSNRDATATKASSCCAAAEAVASINHIDDSPLCLAVIREDGGDVVLFDASGRPRSFQFKSKGVDIRKLCFNTHASQADDLLTPCFDEEGNHGDPEESCFCGVETPHLHAHLRDPRTCGDQEKSGTTGNKSKLEDNLSFLATQTLHAIDSDNSTVATDVDAAQEVPLYNIDVSERLPNECNSAEIFKHVPAATATNKKTALRHRRRKMHPVQHDDHLDYLVHDTTTGELHLEHACTDCGSEDIHGKFRSVGARKLQGQGSTSGIQLQFFEVAGHGPFNVLEFFHNAFELESERVAAVENILNTANSTKKKSKGDSTKPDFWGIPETEPAAVPQKSKVPASFMAPKVLESNRPGDKKTVRSTIACSRICCPAETPVISAILDKLLGIDMVMVNVPLKQVIVDHDALVISTADIESALNNNHFGASVKRDGAAAAGGATTSVIAAPPTKGRSHFFVQHICCASEIPAINKIVEPIKGVSAVSINVTTKTVYVDHDTGFVVAKDICDALNKQGFGAEIRHDFATAAASTRSMFVQSMLTFEHGDPDTEALTAFLRTFDASQLESFVVDVPARTIAIVHNPLGLSAQLIADQLAEPTGIKAIVLSDGASNLKVWDIPAMDESSTDGMEEDEPMTYPSPAVILAGVFWIVSMLSFVGGNW